MQAWLRRELLQARQPAQQAIRVPKAGSAVVNGAVSTGEVAKLTLEATEKGATFQVGSHWCESEYQLQPTKIMLMAKWKI
ncbi:hypothetical protein [Histophilus somni]|uniref:hypothetical protein n=1 Tax=Histophilus somni TaxID=731 RepID=UPI0018EAFD9B|nr:hypothetical protein [Histophilus somni]QQF79572.1 hypothetical protein JFL53_04545 [Histophilus somni]